MATYLVMTDRPRKKPESNRYFRALFFRKTNKLSVDKAVKIQSIASAFMMSEMPKRIGERPMKIREKRAIFSPRSFPMIQ